MFHPVPVGREAGRAVQPVHRAVQRGMRAAQVGRHQIGIVKLRQRSAGMRRAGIEHGMGQGREARQVRAGRQGEGVLDDADPVLKITLQPPTDEAKPCDMHARREEGEMPKLGIHQKANLVAWYRGRL